VAEPRARVFEYSVELGRDGRTAIPGEAAFGIPDGWTPDHLLLAALLHCSVQSFAYHALRAGHDPNSSGSATGRITRRESDGRYAFVEIDCRIAVELEPPAADPSELIAKAERDCFVGATLAVKPRYEWRVS
jgi:organic hydroperoxide reductase OsmC/OhrA